jgi:beta-lactamase class A
LTVALHEPKSPADTQKGSNMAHSRRAFLKTAAGTAAGTATLTALSAPAASAWEQKITPEKIVDLFDDLPGDKAFSILAPGVDGKHKFLAKLNSQKQLFVASAIKTFVLCEALRQAEASLHGDSPDIADVLEQKELTLDSTVWSFGSPTFFPYGPPAGLTGIVSERTTMEAMITRSDNTATDMMLNLAGADKVRKFIASAGLKQTLIPDTTRALTGYLFGAVNYLNLTFEELLEVIQNPQVHPFLNNVETLASSADDFVSYYSRALQGEFFKHKETLHEFRRILTLCDFIYLIPVPLGVSAYAKSGNADTPNFHARSFAGGMFVSGQWVYFAFIINWYASDPEDPETVEKFFSAIHKALTGLKDLFSED